MRDKPLQGKRIEVFTNILGFSNVKIEYSQTEAYRVMVNQIRGLVLGYSYGFRYLLFVLPSVSCPI